MERLRVDWLSARSGAILPGAAHDSTSDAGVQHDALCERPDHGRSHTGAEDPACGGDHRFLGARAGQETRAHAHRDPGNFRRELGLRRAAHR